MTDASKVPELLELARGVDGLATRIQGVGVVSSAASQPVHDAVLEAYRGRFPEAPAETTNRTLGPLQNTEFGFCVRRGSDQR